MNTTGNSVSRASRIPSEDRYPMIIVSIKDTASMTAISRQIFSARPVLFFKCVLYHLMYSTLSAIMMTRAAEFENTCMLALRMSFSLNGSVENRRTIPILRMKMTQTAAISHCIWGENISSLSSSGFLVWKSLVTSSIVHPSTSVVTADAMAFEAWLAPITVCSTSAPIWPNIYPITFATITHAAAYSMLIHLFMQMSRTIDMVRTVRRSSSFIPEYLQTSVTAAWSSAKIWMIQVMFMSLSLTIVQFCCPKIAKLQNIRNHCLRFVI